LLSLSLSLENCRTHMHTHVNMHTDKHKYAYTFAHTKTRTNIYTRAHIRTYVNTHMQSKTQHEHNTKTRTNMHTHAQICTHTHAAQQTHNNTHNWYSSVIEKLSVWMQLRVDANTNTLCFCLHLSMSLSCTTERKRKTGREREREKQRVCADACTWERMSLHASSICTTCMYVFVDNTEKCESKGVLLNKFEYMCTSTHTNAFLVLLSLSRTLWRTQMHTEAVTLIHASTGKGRETRRKRKRGTRTKMRMMCAHWQVWACMYKTCAQHACMCVRVSDKSVRERLCVQIHLCGLATERQTTHNHSLAFSIPFSQRRTLRNIHAHARTHAHRYAYIRAHVHTYTRK